MHGRLPDAREVWTRATGTRRRVLVQSDGHMLNDTGDSAQRLGGVVLVGIALALGLVGRKAAPG